MSFAGRPIGITGAGGRLLMRFSGNLAAKQAGKLGDLSWFRCPESGRVEFGRAAVVSA